MTRAWTYHAVLGNGRDSVLEAGPHATATEALEWALARMGRTGTQVLEELGTEELGGDFDLPLIGYTIERYDGEQTDSDWFLNGGLRRAGS